MRFYFGYASHEVKASDYIINFSTHLTALGLKHKTALDDLVHFLSPSFHGKTNVIPAIEYALEMLPKPNFQCADVIVI